MPVPSRASNAWRHSVWFQKRTPTRPNESHKKPYTQLTEGHLQRGNRMAEGIAVMTEATHVRDNGTQPDRCLPMNLKIPSLHHRKTPISVADPYYFIVAKAEQTTTFINRHACKAWCISPLHLMHNNGCENRSSSLHTSAPLWGAPDVPSRTSFRNSQENMTRDENGATAGG